MKYTPRISVISFSLLAIASLCTLATPGCGSSSSSSPSPTPTSGTTDSAASNPEVSAQSGTIALEDASDAISDGGTSTATSLAAGEKDFTVARTCEQAIDSGAVKVVGTYSGDASATRTAGKLTFVLSGTASGTETHTWTPPTGQTSKISCASATGVAKIKWLNSDVVSGLKLEIAVDKSRSSTLTVSGGKRANKVITKADSIKGTRTVVWASSTLSADDVRVTRTKSITSNITRSHTFTAKDGTVKKIEGTFAVDAATPLLVEVVRAVPGGELQQKTVKSGTVSHTDADGTTTSTTFKDVLFSYAATNANRCIPVSGTLEISSTAKGSTDAKKTTLVFADSAGTITYPDGTTDTLEDYNPKCDLERD